MSVNLSSVGEVEVSTSQRYSVVTTSLGPILVDSKKGQSWLMVEELIYDTKAESGYVKGFYWQKINDYEVLQNIPFSSSKCEVCKTRK